MHDLVVKYDVHIARLKCHIHVETEIVRKIVHHAQCFRQFRTYYRRIWIDPGRIEIPADYRDRQ